MAVNGRGGLAIAKKANGSNAFIVKSLTSMHSRRAGPKVPHPDNLERRTKLRCTALRDTHFLTSN